MFILWAPVSTHASHLPFLTSKDGFTGTASPLSRRLRLLVSSLCYSACQLCVSVFHKYPNSGTAGEVVFSSNGKTGST